MKIVKSENFPYTIDPTIADFGVDCILCDKRIERDTVVSNIEVEDANTGEPWVAVAHVDCDRFLQHKTGNVELAA